ncbi:MAG: hypothetical protein V1731_00940 [Candidatus Aenigmatarchaeota archaeon]
MKTEKMFTDVFIVVIAAILVITAYFLISMSNVLSPSDNVTRAVLLLSLMMIISSVIQLAILATVSKIRDKMERKK